MLSAASLDTNVEAPKTMQIQVEVQGKLLLFLLDSGSSACFIDQKHVGTLNGKELLPLPVKVQVAGGAILDSEEYFPALRWSTAGVVFSDPFRILSLGSYDGIIGLDWLAKHSPMLTHWAHGWLSLQYEGKPVVLHSSIQCNVLKQWCSYSWLVTCRRKIRHLFRQKFRSCWTNSVLFLRHRLGCLREGVMTITYLWSQVHNRCLSGRIV